jgi:hypothetical protein
MTEPVELLSNALAAMPGGIEPEFNRADRPSGFGRLIDLCIDLFPETIGQNYRGEPDRDGARWALVHALRFTGMPKHGAVIGPGEMSCDAVARIIVDAMTATQTKLLYLCPLDLADDLPRVNFGPCEIREFTQAEFENVIQAPHLRRSFPHLRLDTGALSRFTWLVVEENLPMPDRAGKRSFPALHLDLNRDFGEINPHSHAWPNVVEQAVFMLLLLPLEQLGTYADIEWRTFRIPWIYTVKSDPFVSPALPRGHETLTWEPDIFDDPYTGETVELEKPTRMLLLDNSHAAFNALTDQRWQDIGRAVQSPIFNPLVAHFMVRAFTSDDIDEFLAHIIVIDAAIGMASDHDARRRPTITGSQGATERVSRRAAAITGEPGAAAEYKELFKIRSEFVHGRQLAAIPSAKRIAARSLARRVADGLVDAALAGNYGDRDSFLSSLCP